MKDGFEVMQLGHTALGRDWCLLVPRVGAWSGAVAAGLCPWGGCPGPFLDGLCSTGRQQRGAGSVASIGADVSCVSKCNSA